MGAKQLDDGRKYLKMTLNTRNRRWQFSFLFGTITKEKGMHNPNPNLNPNLNPKYTYSGFLIEYCTVLWALIVYQNWKPYFQIIRNFIA